MRNVARAFYMPDPRVLGDYYLDALDYRGLFFWAEDAEEQAKQMEREKSKANYS